MSMCIVTGFPEWILFNAFFKLVSPHLSDRTKLPKLSMVLMFLRLNLFDKDLAQRFSVHSSTVSRHFHRVLDVAFEATFVIQWPERDVLRLIFQKIF